MSDDELSTRLAARLEHASKLGDTMIAVPLHEAVSLLVRLGGLPTPGVIPFAQMERRLIYAAMVEAKGSTTKAGQLLEMSPRTVRYKLMQYRRADASPCDSAA